jgi:spore germination protein
MVMKNLRLFFLFTLALLLLVPFKEGLAQNAAPSGPVYIVEEGDSLWDIAYRFHVSQDELADANGITDPNQITIGQPLVIPGLEGIQGVLTTQSVPYGESLESLSLRYGVPTQALKRLNHITSPREVYAGYSLVIPLNETSASPGKRLSMEAGQSTLEVAILNNTDPWNLMAENNIENSWAILPGKVLWARGKVDLDRERQKYP